MEEKDTIQVLVVPPVVESEEPMPGRQAFPGARTLGAKVVDIPVDAAKESIQKVARQVAEIVRDMPTDIVPVRLDEITIELTVSANGNLQWVVGGGVEVGSTVTLTFKVNDLGGEDF